MTAIFRYTGMGLWILILWALPLGFWLLPGIGAWFSRLPETWAMAGFLACAAIIQGLVLDTLGKRRIKGLIREGDIWQQAGLRSKAEERYIKAIRIIDSALIFPWPGRRIYSKFNRVLAGFYLTGEVSYPGFKAVADRYLARKPEDETLVLLWLERWRPGSGTDDPNTRSLLAAMADAHHSNPKMALKLAGPCVEAGKKDLSALRLYRSVLNFLETREGETGSLSPAHKEQIQALLEKSQVPETLAHPLGLTGERPAPEPGPGKGPTLGDQVFSAGIPGGTGQGQKEGQWLPADRTGIPGFFHACKRVGQRGGSRVIGLWTGLKKENRLGAYIKNTLILGVAAGLVFFIYTSLAHYFKSPGSDLPKYSVGAHADGAFTIQVAAYLKEAHADQYVKYLGNAGVSAHIKQTSGGGQTWYLVRVSSFKDKDAAAAFGRTLKSQGKIQDFFVSNL